MAQIDLKEATIKIFDGTLGTATVDSTPADADLVLTAVSRHVGTDKISITLVDPSTASAALSIVVTGRDIVVNLATSSASAITSTAAQIKTAIDGDSDASALVTVALETAGTGVVEAAVKATLDGQNSISIKIGEGNLTYNEHRNVEFTRDRGILDTVRTADEEPVDVSLDAIWEFITAETSSGTPTIEDALKKVGEAAAWVSTADDQCQPYCVDVEVHNAPDCTGTDDEFITLEEYYYEALDHDLREGTIATSGRCNRKVATARRVAAADIA
jgi:hypothetical protein